MEKNRHKNKKGSVFLIAGLLLIGAALALFCYNRWDANRADEAAQEVVTRLAEQIPERADDDEEQYADDDADGYAGELMESLAGREMPTIEVDGYSYIGMLEVPDLKLTLPVMADWDYDRLKIAPCRFAGSVYDDNLVVAGHNYARHFSQLKWLPVGSGITFTDVEGNVFRYTLTLIETLDADNLEGMVEDSEDWDLTLFTCTTGGGSRCTLRLVRTQAERS